MDLQPECSILVTQIFESPAPGRVCCRPKRTFSYGFAMNAILDRIKALIWNTNFKYAGQLMVVRWVKSGDSLASLVSLDEFVVSIYYVPTITL